MALTPGADEASRAVRGLAAELRTQLGDGFEPYPARTWPGEVAELCALVEHLTWARDAALVLARRADVQWSDLAAAAGVSDSTLHGRYRRFLAREYP